MNKLTKNYLNKIANIVGEPVFLYCNGYTITDYINVHINKSSEWHHVFVKTQSNIIASFCLTEMPSCCMILILHNSNINNKYRNKGIGSILFELKLQIAKELGYATVLCTDIANNTPQRKILAKNGFIDVYDNINPRTDHKVFISIKTII